MLPPTPRVSAPPTCPPAADGSVSVSNQVGSAACVTIHLNALGQATIEKIEVQPGWTSTVESAGGTSDRSRIQIEFNNKAAKTKAELRWEAGRLVIK